mmetsp:Transcript_24205/g.22009  ORF Transcript_24205/g.22009 Transcript_24205/m.22009 type:complete len:390 (-) Transcript_24205:43-1212(-)
MVLEATVICLDNSEWMRNGDYSPSRLESQYDAVGILCNDRTQTNPENTVGILSMASKGVELLVSPTEDIGKILACFSKIKIGGESDLATTIQISQLALKHRKNKNGGQRIVVFVGSPISTDTDSLIKIGKQLKKNSIALDIVSLGEINENQKILSELIESVNNGDNSHLIVVPPGVSPADALYTSTLMQDSPFAPAPTNSSSGGVLGSSNGFDGFGVDPELDPELAMALRVSTEEARANEEARAKAAIEESANSGALVNDNEEDEETLMQRALELSMRDYEPEPVTNTTTNNIEESNNDDDLDEDEALRLALEMSMVHSPETKPDTTNNNSTINPEYLNSLLGSVDVDLTDPQIQAALAQLSGENVNNNDSNNNTNSKKRKNDDSDDSK